MGKKLLIAEKPSVAREFARVLGVNTIHDGYMENGEWIVTYCIGHLVSLAQPEAYDPDLKKWRMETLPIMPGTYRYEVLAKTAAQYKVVATQLSRTDVDVVYNAGDSAREGEYIQRLVYAQAGNRHPVKRVWINSQTDDEIRRGIAEAQPSASYDHLADAAYERAISDWLVGMNLSRVLTLKHGRAFNRQIASERNTPIAVGRVMTCVLGMVVNREREIKGFTETKYYKIDANVGGVAAHWKAVDGSKYYASEALHNGAGFIDAGDAHRFVDELRAAPWLKIVEINKKTEKKAAPALFNLTELQAECAKRYKYGPDKTLQIAQTLYEKKMTTYPRTDARVLSRAVASEIDKYLDGLAGLAEWANAVVEIRSNGWHKALETNKRYVDDSKITDHYAIIPTGEHVKGVSELSQAERLVYTMIVRRFLAVFFPPAEYAATTVTLQHCSGEQFNISEKVLVTPGYQKITPQARKSEAEQAQPTGPSPIGTWKKGDSITAEYVVVDAATKPPVRYTTGTIVLAMEGAGKLIEDQELREQIKGSGIGTTATRAETVAKLLRLGYLSVEEKSQVLMPTASGDAIYDICRRAFPQLLSPAMTASWEKGLTQIEHGEITAARYRETLEQYIRKAVERIRDGQPESTATQSRPRSGAHSGKAQRVGFCPRCGRPVYAWTKSYSCAGTLQNQCSFTLWKDPSILAKSNIELTPEMAETLLEGKHITIGGLISKTGHTYRATFKLDDSNDRVSLSMSFPTPITSRRKRRKIERSPSNAEEKNSENYTEPGTGDHDDDVVDHSGHGGLERGRHTADGRDC